LLEKGAKLEERDLGREPLSVAELDALIGERDHLEFLNRKNELFRRLGWKERSPSRAEALKQMAKEPNLIRRPIVVRGNRMVLGFDEAALEKLTR
jgi:arsenate reductase-like glutaredoxin family protein